MILPASFVQDLRWVFETECSTMTVEKCWRLPPGFREDLRDVATDIADEAPGDTSMEELKHLQCLLGRLQETSKQKLAQLLDRLPSDHPAKCPVSLFGSMGLGRLEVAHTHTLAWLLDPKQRHGFGNRLLRALLRQIGRNDTALSGVIVCAERSCGDSGSDGAGRTDVWVEDKQNHWLLVIEAKVDAAESDGQLARYEKEIDRCCGGGKRWDVYRVFLTPNGRPAKSARKGSAVQWNAVSFASLVHGFWAEARESGNSLEDRAGYHFLRYYLAGVMRDILDLPLIDHLPPGNCFRLIEFLRKEPGE